MSNLNTTSFNTWKMVRLESVLHDVYRLIDQNLGITQDNILESAASGMSHLYNYKLYETAICILPINNHKAMMPDYYEVMTAYYQSDLNEVDLSALDDIIVTHQIDLANTTCASSALNPCSVSETISNSGTVGKVSGKCIYKLKNVAPDTGWVPMTLSHNITNLLHIQGSSSNPNCSTDPNGTASYCQYTYSLSKDILTSSAREGFVLLVYKRTPRDEEGHLLIPSHPLVNEALKAYVMMEIHELQMNMHIEGSVGLYDRYFNKWERTAAAASGELVKPSLPEWVSIVRDNRFFRDDAPERIYEDSPTNEYTDIGYTSGGYSSIY